MGLWQFVYGLSVLNGSSSSPWDYVSPSGVHNGSRTGILAHTYGMVEVGTRLPCYPQPLAFASPALQLLSHYIITSWLKKHQNLLWLFLRKETLLVSRSMVFSVRFIRIQGREMNSRLQLTPTNVLLTPNSQGPLDAHSNFWMVRQTSSIQTQEDKTTPFVCTQDALQIWRI